MIPRYGEWDQAYRRRGLRVVGIHSPETDGERDRKSVLRYVRSHRIRWTVVLDPYLEAWKRYRVRAWPTALLIDRKGVVRHAFVGDESARAIEARLRDLLSES